MLNSFLSIMPGARDMVLKIKTCIMQIPDL